MRRNNRPVAPWATLTVVLIAAACADPLDYDAGPVELAIAASVVADGATDAYLKTDAVHVLVQTSSEIAADETLPFEPSSGTAGHAQVRLDGDFAGQQVLIEVELLANGSPVFDGSTTATPMRGTPAEVEVTLRPVVAAIDAPAQAGPITTIGGTLQLEAAAVFATGDEVPGATLTWIAIDPDVVGVSTNGLATGNSEGVGRVEVSSGTAFAVIEVLVQAVVTSVDVSPPSATIPIGSSLTFTFVPRDANGTALGGRTATWSSSNTNVLGIGTTTGTATGVATGSATVTATVDGVEGTAQVTVIENIPTSPSNMTASVTGTTVDLNWFDNADNETYFEVLRAQGPSGQPTVIAQLSPNATSYQDRTGTLDERFEYSVWACNQEGCSDPSNSAVVYTAPRAPTNLQWFVSSVTDRWSLLWNDNSQYETEFVIEYRQQTIPPSAWGKVWATAPANTTSWDFGFGGPPLGYDFRVVACNDAGCSPSQPISSGSVNFEPPAGTATKGGGTE